MVAATKAALSSETRAYDRTWRRSIGAGSLNAQNLHRMKLATAPLAAAAKAAEVTNIRASSTRVTSKATSRAWARAPQAPTRIIRLVMRAGWTAKQLPCQESDARIRRGARVE